MEQPTLFRWSKLVSPDEENHWETQLTIEDLFYSVESLAKRQKIRFSVYCQSRDEAEAIRERHGGGVNEVLPEHWEPSIDPDNARVLRIRDRFIISETDDAAALDELAAENPDKEILSFPPQLAFGTGGHPTTANCLRLLVDASSSMSGQWGLLDLGCGSGILSVAAAKLGAERAVAVELDARALDYAMQNGERHDVCDTVDFVEADALEMLKTPPERPYEVVAANLFSSLLVQVLPLLAEHGWVAPQGYVIISGFLTSQTGEVDATAKTSGFPLDQFLRRGKWVAASGQKA